MKRRPFNVVAGIVFTLVGVAQAIRFLKHVPVMAGSHVIPLWPSAVAAVILISLALWGFRSSRQP